MTGLTKQILDSLSSGVAAVDLGNRILFLNRALARSLGIDPEQWLGRPLSDLQELVDARLIPHGAFRTLLDELQETGGRFTKELQWRSGAQVIDLRQDGSPLRDSAGKIVGRVVAWHEVTREKTIDRMKTEFIAVASHELRTPMTSVKGSIDLILSGATGEISGDTQELLEIARKGCDRLVRLINDILDLAKIEAGQITLKPVPMDLTEAVERSLNCVRPLAEADQVALRLRRPEYLPLAHVDRDRIEQVITNLLSNAIKFSPPKGEVCAELSCDEESVRCTVIDHGCGIPEAELERIFDKFHQVTEMRRKGGTGLGLAIARALVHEHRGEIWAESKLNEGARFTFRLPRASP
jgi:PAS domain S-box-containing protein